jgi:hypothetical protein
MSGSTFVSRYRPGVIFAPKPGLVIAPVIFIPCLMLFKSTLFSGLVTLLAIVGGSIYWNRQRKRTPALMMSPDGLVMEGLKLTPWTNITGIDRAYDAKGNPALVLAFARRAPQVNASPLWRIAGPKTVMVHVSLLADPFEEIEQAFEHFIRA